MFSHSRPITDRRAKRPEIVNCSYEMGMNMTLIVVFINNNDYNCEFELMMTTVDQFGMILSLIVTLTRPKLIIITLHITRWVFCFSSSLQFTIFPMRKQIVAKIACWSSAVPSVWTTVMHIGESVETRTWDPFPGLDCQNQLKTSEWASPQSRHQSHVKLVRSENGKKKQESSAGRKKKGIIKIERMEGHIKIGKWINGKSKQ